MTDIDFFATSSQKIQCIWRKLDVSDNGYSWLQNHRDLFSRSCWYWLNEFSGQKYTIDTQYKVVTVYLIWKVVIFGIILTKPAAPAFKTFPVLNPVEDAAVSESSAAKFNPETSNDTFFYLYWWHLSIMITMRHFWTAF